MASVQIVDVRKDFGAVKVVKGIDIDIRDGEFVALVGPSGCGKSTLLRMIAGLEQVSGGEIRVGAKTVNNVAPKDRDIAMVFQNYALYPHMTVADNMGFSLKLKGVAKTEIQDRVRKAADILALNELLGRFPRQLSGGQRQRVAMGRAIVRDPQVFLFDEPLSNLDAKLRVQMRAEIKEVYQRLKTTTIYVTHDQVEAMTMADRIVVMHDGVVEQIGEPLEVYDRPDNVFVASFIGSPAINLYEGVFRSGEKPVFETNAGLVIPLASIPDGYLGVPAVLGIRPEHIAIHPEGAVKATLTIIEPTGSETYIICNSGSETVRCLVRDRIGLHPGDTATLHLDPAKLIFFDGRTKRRI